MTMHADDGLAGRLLVLIRHGEAQATSTSGDHGRELTARGREDARGAGRWLVGQGIRPDVVIVSSATRTAQTWDELEAAGLTAGEVRTDRAVYNGTRHDVLEAVGAVPDAARVVLVVGHAPAVPEVVWSVDARCDVPRDWGPAALGVVAWGEAGWGPEIPVDAVVIACRRPDPMRGAVS